LRRRANAYRRALSAHRDGARIVTHAARLRPRTLAAFERDLAALIGHGFGPTAALRTITAITQYVNGFVLQEQHGGRAVTALDTIELAARPHLVAAVRGAGHTEEERLSAAFDHGLDVLIAGTEQKLAGA
jgi:TetR/AcrR family tetracycline transcriptional repressor